MTDTGALAVVGSVNLDTTLHVERIPGAGETILSRDRLVSPGGKGANQAAAAATGPGTVHFICAIGGEDDTDRALGNLRSAGVDLTAVQRREDEATGSAVILVGDDAENLIVVDLGANAALDPDHVDATLRSLHPAVILTQLESPYAVTRVCAEFDAARWRILNPAPMTSRVPVHTLLAGFNIVIPNRTELAQLVDRPEPATADDVREYVAALGFDGVVVVTLGADGAALFEQPGSDGIHFAPPTVEPIDTSGAGDVFCGVFASELAAHGDLRGAVAEAVRMSALSTQMRGAQLSTHGAAALATHDG